MSALLSISFRTTPPPLPSAARMGKAPGSAAPKVTRKASKEASAGSAQRAQHILENSLKKSHLAENTLKSYKQQINTAQKWLWDLQLDADVTEGLLLAGVRALDSDAGDNAQEENEDGDTNEKYDPLKDPDVRLAFEKPIRATPYLIAMYIAWIVFEKKRSKSTAESVYSAFKWAFSEMYGLRVKHGMGCGKLTSVMLQGRRSLERPALATQTGVEGGIRRNPGLGK